MAKSKLPHQKAPVITIQKAEFDHVARTLFGIQRKAKNVLQVLAAIDARAASEFAESMRIIRGLQPENEGGAR
jgi:hypothetical protein